ncbi:MAG: cell division protein FtsL [Paracoccaceae bacterium]
MSRNVLLILAALIVATAGWAYHVNYKTITAIDEVRDLRRQVAKEREQMQVLRVEWAYLNAPERLARLVAQHQARLELVPLVPEFLGEVAEIPFPKNRTPDPEEQLSTVNEPSPLPLPATRPVAWAPAADLIGRVE